MDLREISSSLFLLSGTTKSRESKVEAIGAATPTP